MSSRAAAGASDLELDSKLSEVYATPHKATRGDMCSQIVGAIAHAELVAPQLRSNSSSAALATQLIVSARDSQRWIGEALVLLTRLEQARERDRKDVSCSMAHSLHLAALICH